MAAREISLADIEQVRSHRWRTASARQITDERGALKLIAELGFVLLMPISGTELPSIHTATRDQWSWWDWKQTLPGRKACYYAKILRRRGTFIAWKSFPSFYAAYADPRSYRHLYRDGLLDRAEKQVLDLLDAQGPLMTRDIRLAFGPRSKANTRRVKSMLVSLQTRFLITTAGGDTEGWSHHRWDLVDRWVPAGALAAARALSQGEARAALVARFVENVVATTPADIAWTFGWDRGQVDPLISELLGRGEIAAASAPELGGEVVVPARWPAREGRSRGRVRARG